MCGEAEQSPGAGELITKDCGTMSGRYVFVSIPGTSIRSIELSHLRCLCLFLRFVLVMLLSHAGRREHLHVCGVEVFNDAGFELGPCTGGARYHTSTTSLHRFTTSNVQVTAAAPGIHNSYFDGAEHGKFEVKRDQNYFNEFLLSINFPFHFPHFHLLDAQSATSLPQRDWIQSSQNCISFLIYLFFFYFYFLKKIPGSDTDAFVPTHMTWVYSSKPTHNFAHWLSSAVAVLAEDSFVLLRFAELADINPSPHRTVSRLLLLSVCI
jgi:hypothetical protein